MSNRIIFSNAMHFTNEILKLKQTDKVERCIIFLLLPCQPIRRSVFYSLQSPISIIKMAFVSSSYKE
jgi:hypothetical protein